MIDKFVPQHRVTDEKSLIKIDDIDMLPNYKQSDQVIGAKAK